MPSSPTCRRLMPRTLSMCATLAALQFVTANCAFAQSSNVAVKLNQIQVIGSHNSYHHGIAPNEAKLWQAKDAESFKGLDYNHPLLAKQVDAGVRQIELDIFADTKGGPYAQPSEPGTAGAQGLSACPRAYH